jgi:hypothetical protein
MKRSANESGLIFGKVIDVPQGLSGTYQGRIRVTGSANAYLKEYNNIN